MHLIITHKKEQHKVKIEPELDRWYGRIQKSEMKMDKAIQLLQVGIRYILIKLSIFKRPHSYGKLNLTYKKIEEYERLSDFYAVRIQYNKTFVKALVVDRINGGGFRLIYTLDIYPKKYCPCGCFFTTMIRPKHINSKKHKKSRIKNIKDLPLFKDLPMDLIYVIYDFEYNN